MNAQCAQFQRRRPGYAFQMALVVERERGVRYSHVIRMRADAVGLFDWPSIRDLT